MKQETAGSWGLAVATVAAMGATVFLTYQSASAAQVWAEPGDTATGATPEAGAGAGAGAGAEAGADPGGLDGSSAVRHAGAGSCTAVGAASGPGNPMAVVGTFTVDLDAADTVEDTVNLSGAEGLQPLAAITVECSLRKGHGVADYPVELSLTGFSGPDRRGTEVLAERGTSSGADGWQAEPGGTTDRQTITFRTRLDRVPAEPVWSAGIALRRLPR